MSLESISKITEVRVSTFPVIIARMSECMALRYLPSSSLDFAGPELWRTAARCFVSIVQSGLPSVNITMQNQLQQHGGEAAVGVDRRSSSTGSSPLALESMAQSHGAQLQGSNPSGHPPGQQASPKGQQQQQLSATSTAWPLLAQAFEIFLLGGHDGVLNLLNHLSLEKECSGTAATVRAASTIAIPAPSLETAVQPVHPGAGSAAPSQKLVLATAEDSEIQASVLDCLADTVLTSCQFAPLEIRQVCVMGLTTFSS
ncbi:hypothetical protein CEUSTIGMA_g6400.t1 [Chlamydomonas eustigma]|uniref:Uncharacterized protein n=1 Tax=Chlamydomonas eustigma TaxID=1157962 RepID=A0A250X872_9CHLO|nr:hypothetical protein CEUSTIGMA_g6400.t1 [Chlamydomonas eustigma]|eukprot:GAX78960.1 hypothetical protein CEUSTIGMA_g6400.t1 [Chlamydomonas eustigma]